MSTEKKFKIEFAPGCFDNFDGTQEELDAMIAEITRLAESGELMDMGEPLTQDGFDMLPPDEQDRILDAFHENTEPRKLQ